MDYYDPPRPGRPSEDDEPDDADSSPQTMHESHTQSTYAKGGFQYIGAELDDMAPIWRVYRDEIITHDKTVTLDEWNKTLDVLLIFAGLFSAVVTTFVVSSFPLLQPEDDYAASALYALVQSLNNTAIAPTFPKPASSPSSVSPMIRWINALWFTSLFISLAVALLSILAKQWLEEYVHRMAATQLTSTKSTSTLSSDPPSHVSEPGTSASFEGGPTASLAPGLNSTRTGAMTAFNNVAAFATPTVMPVWAKPTLWTAAATALQTAFAVTQSTTAPPESEPAPSLGVPVPVASRAWASRRRFYFGGLHSWRAPGFITQALPLLLHLALFLFLIGLVMFIMTLDGAIAAWVLALSSVLAVFYIICTALPIWWQNCPTATPLLKQIRQLLTEPFIALLEVCATVHRQLWQLWSRLQARVRGALSLPLHRDDSGPTQYGVQGVIDGLRRFQGGLVPESDWETRNEKVAVIEETLKWLILVSGSDRAVTVAYQAIGGLPLDSQLIPSLRYVAKSMTAGSLRTTASAVDIIRAIRSDLVLGRGSWRLPMLGLDVPSSILEVLQQSYYPDAIILAAAMGGDCLGLMRLRIFDWLLLESGSLPSTILLLLQCQDAHPGIVPYLLLLLDPDSLRGSDYAYVFRVPVTRIRRVCPFHGTYGRGCNHGCIVLRLAQISASRSETVDGVVIALAISRFMGWAAKRTHYSAYSMQKDLLSEDVFLDFIRSPSWLSRRVLSRIDVGSMVASLCHYSSPAPRKAISYCQGLCNILRICTDDHRILVVQTLINVLNTSNGMLQSGIRNVLAESAYPDTGLLLAMIQPAHDGLSYIRENTLNWLSVGSQSSTGTASLLLDLEFEAISQVTHPQHTAPNLNASPYVYAWRLLHLLLFVDFRAPPANLERAISVMRRAVPTCSLARRGIHRCDVLCLVVTVARMALATSLRITDRQVAASVILHLLPSLDDEPLNSHVMHDDGVLALMARFDAWERVWEDKRIDARAFARYTLDARLFEEGDTLTYVRALRNLLRVFKRQPVDTIDYTTNRIAAMFGNLMEKETANDQHSHTWAIEPGIWDILLQDLIQYVYSTAQEGRNATLFPLASVIAAAVCMLKRRRYGVSNLVGPFLSSVRRLLSSTSPMDLRTSLLLHLAQHCVEIEPTWCNDLDLLNLRADRDPGEIFPPQWWLRNTVEFCKAGLDEGPCTKCPGTPPVWVPGRPAGRVATQVFQLQLPSPGSDEELNWQNTCELPFLGYDFNL